jgi:hypothetical protein
MYVLSHDLPSLPYAPRWANSWVCACIYMFASVRVCVRVFACMYVQCVFVRYMPLCISDLYTYIHAYVYTHKRISDVRNCFAVEVLLVFQQNLHTYIHALCTFHFQFWGNAELLCGQSDCFQTQYLCSVQSVVLCIQVLVSFVHIYDIVVKRPHNTQAFVHVCAHIIVHTHVYMYIYIYIYVNIYYIYTHIHM